MNKMKEKRIFAIGATIGIGALLLSSCLDNEWEDCEKSSKEDMDKYITKNTISDEFKKDVDGGTLYYIPDTLGTGLSPEMDNYIVVDYTGMYLDGTIIETTDSSMKEKWDATNFYKDYAFGPAKFKFGYSRAGFNYGLSYMKEGGWATLIIPTELAFYDCKPVLYKINLIKVIKNPVTYEKEAMLRYLSENGMDTIANAYEGIFYKVTSTTDDTMEVTKNDTLLIRFTGKYTYENKGLLCLKEFDSNIEDKDPLKIVYGKDAIQSGYIKYMPVGFTTALDTMRKGTHAVAVLPYEKAFGTTGLINSVYGYYIVPQYQTVIYDLYIEDIKRPQAK
jgi:FKBP-type peptidyl-prolyl cis-trans isomerase FkpA